MDGVIAAALPAPPSIIVNMFNAEMKEATTIIAAEHKTRRTNIPALVNSYMAARKRELRQYNKTNVFGRLLLTVRMPDAFCKQSDIDRMRQSITEVTHMTIYHDLKRMVNHVTSTDMYAGSRMRQQVLAWAPTMFPANDELTGNSLLSDFAPRVYGVTTADSNHDRSVCVASTPDWSGSENSMVPVLTEPSTGYARQEWNNDQLNLAGFSAILGKLPHDMALVYVAGRHDESIAVQHVKACATLLHLIGIQLPSPSGDNTVVRFVDSLARLCEPGVLPQEFVTLLLQLQTIRLSEDEAQSDVTRAVISVAPRINLHLPMYGAPVGMYDSAVTVAMVVKALRRGDVLPLLQACLPPSSDFDASELKRTWPNAGGMHFVDWYVKRIDDLMQVAKCCSNEQLEELALDIEDNKRKGMYTYADNPRAKSRALPGCYTFTMPTGDDESIHSSTSCTQLVETYNEHGPTTAMQVLYSAVMGKVRGKSHTRTLNTLDGLLEACGFPHSLSDYADVVPLLNDMATAGVVVQNVCATWIMRQHRLGDYGVVDDQSAVYYPMPPHSYTCGGHDIAANEFSAMYDAPRTFSPHVKSVTFEQRPDVYWLVDNMVLYGRENAIQKLIAYGSMSGGHARSVSGIVMFVIGYAICVIGVMIYAATRILWWQACCTVPPATAVAVRQ